jgi:hypothetical protein
MTERYLERAGILVNAATNTNGLQTPQYEGSISRPPAFAVRRVV